MSDNRTRSFLTPSSPGEPERPTVPAVEAFSEALAPPASVPGYELLGELGRGGMGVVYKARHLKLNRVVALKMILAGGHAGESDLFRFRSEAEAVARLQHPNIVQIYEVGEHEGRPFFSLEYVDGGSLADQLNGKPLPPEQAADLIEKLARAVHAAHQAGVIHRDLKPANVLLAACGLADPGPEGAKPQAASLNPKLTDFGLAKRLDVVTAPTQTGSILGTPSYMAPEQAQGKSRKIGPAADLYALGAILYEMLTGRPPFVAANQMETLYQVLHDEPVPLTRLQSKTPRDLETICLKCLEKEPRRRYASAEELADDLKRFLNQEPIRARPVSMIERGIKWARRRPAAAALIAVSVLATAALLVLGLVYNARLQKAIDQVEVERTEAEKSRERAAAIEREAEANRYISHVGLAHQFWQSNQVALARQTLAKCPEALRGWEWDYLNRLCHAERLTFRGHAGMVQAVAFSRDGKLAASASMDGQLCVWEADHGQEVLRVTATAESLAFSPDGKHLARAESGTVKVCEIPTGREVRSFRPNDCEVQAVVFTPDGKLLAAGNCRKVAAGPVTDAWLTFRKPTEMALRASGVPLSPTLVDRAGKLLGVLGVKGNGEPARGRPMRHETVKVWDAETDQVLHTWSAFEVPEEIVSQSRLVFSPDGRRLAGMAIDTGMRVQTRFRDVSGMLEVKGQKTDSQPKTDEPGAERQEEPGPAQAEPGPAPVSYRGQVKVWNVITGREEGAFEGASNRFADLALSPQGRYVAWSDGTRVLLGDVTLRQPPRPLLGHQHDVNGVAFSPDGKFLTSAGDDLTVRVWDVAAGAEAFSLRGHDTPILRVAYNADGRRLVSAGGKLIGRSGEVKLWDATMDPQARTFRRQRGPLALALATSPDGRRLAVVSATLDAPGPRRELTVWEPVTEKLIFSHAAKIGQVPLFGAFSPDGRLLAVTSGGITVYDLDTGRELPGFKASEPPDSLAFTALTFSPDGRYLATAQLPNPNRNPGKDKAARVGVTLWDVATGREVRAFNNVAVAGTEVVQAPATTVAVLGLTYSSDGRYLAGAITGFVREATGLRTEGEVQVWEAATGKPVAAFQRPHLLQGVAFRPDGRQLAAAGGDLSQGQAVVWDLESRQEVLALQAHIMQMNALAFSPDGRRLVTASNDRTLKLWDATTGQELITLRGHGGEVAGVAFSPDGRQLFSTTGLDLLGILSMGATPEKLRRPAELKIWDATPLAPAGEAGK